VFNTISNLVSADHYCLQDIKIQTLAKARNMTSRQEQSTVRSLGEKHKHDFFTPFVLLEVQVLFVFVLI
jgi:hypothetical protein